MSKPVKTANKKADKPETTTIAKKKGKKKFQPLFFERVATPAEPNLDKHLGVFILKKFGGDRYKVAENPKWIPFTTGVMPGGKSFRDYPDTAFIDCGGSPFDGHRAGGHVAGCELIAKILRCDNRHEIRLLLEKVAGEDSRGARGVKNHMAQAVKAINRWGHFPEEVYRWCETAFNSILSYEEKLWRSLDHVEDPSDRRKKFYAEKRPWVYFSVEAIAKVIASEKSEEISARWLHHAEVAFAEQQKRFNDAVGELRNGETRNIKMSHGPVAKMLVIESDSDQIAPASRFKGYAIALVKNSEGNVVILTNQRCNLDLTGVAAEVRRMEMDSKGIKIPDENILRSEGTIKGCHNWHLHQGIGGSHLYNGTRTASSVEPTCLSLETIAQAIERILGEKRLVTLSDKF